MTEKNTKNDTFIKLNDYECSTDERLYLRRKRIIAIISVILFVAFSMFVIFVVAGPFLEMIDDPAAFRAWVDGRRLLGRLAVIGIICLQAVFSFLPAEPMEISSGYAFGSFEGALLCSIGFLIAGIIMFSLTRLWGIKLVELFVSREKIYSLKYIKDPKKLRILVFILFFIPGIPKDLLTYFFALTPIKMWEFLLISTCARFPAIISSSIVGNALGEQRYKAAIIVFAVIAVVSLVGIWVYKKYFHHTSQNEKKDDK